MTYWPADLLPYWQRQFCRTLPSWRQGFYTRSPTSYFICYFTIINKIRTLFILGKQCVKCVQIRSFFWSIFFRIRTEHGPEKTPYFETFHAVKNTDITQGDFKFDFLFRILYLKIFILSLTSEILSQVNKMSLTIYKLH